MDRSNSNNSKGAAFWKCFAINFILTLIIQIVFAGLALATGEFKLFIAGCILSVLLKIILAARSKLKIFKKIFLIIIMPTNYTYPVIAWLIITKTAEFIQMLPDNLG